MTGMGVCAALLSVAGLSWACLMATATPMLLPAQPERAPAGTMVTVAGRQWVPSVDVEVRLDAVAGPVLAVAPVRQDGTFASEVRVPDIAPGGHLFVVVQGAAAKSTPFEVARPGSVVTDQAPAPPAEPVPTTRVDPVTSQRVSGGTGAPAVPPAPAPAPAAQEQVQAQVPVQVPAGTNPAAPVPSTAGSPASAVTSPVTSPAGAAGPTVSTAPSAPAPALPTAPFNVSAGDLWSGFSSLGSSTEGPSLLDLPSARPSRGPASPLPAGAGLLAAGLLALFGGFAVAELARRRVPTR